MQNPVRVTATDAGYNLSEETPDSWQRQADAFADVVAALLLIHVRFQIVSYVFENQVQSTRLSLDDIKQLHLLNSDNCQ